MLFLLASLNSPRNDTGTLVQLSKVASTATNNTFHDRVFTSADEKTRSNNLERTICIFKIKSYTSVLRKTNIKYFSGFELRFLASTILCFYLEPKKAPLFYKSSYLSVFYKIDMKY